MSLPIQLDLFDNGNEINELRHKVNAIEESSHKVRKSLFAKHGSLAKMYMDLHNRLEILERNICNGKN